MGLGPAIEASEVGVTGLIWLFLTYGYVLYYASNLISEGSELLLLVPSMAGLVGGVVLPLLGAVPDGAIILFSGLGSIEEAQETLSVGVGALAGSTIMLLTVPFMLSVYGGRVDILDGTPFYHAKPKLTDHGSPIDNLSKTGVAITEACRHGGIIMVITTLPYFLIQVPAMFMHGPDEEVAHGEHWWSLGALVVCLSGLFFYMKLQLKISREGEDKIKRMAVTKKLLKKGKVSLSGATAVQLQEFEARAQANGTAYQAVNQDDLIPPPAIYEMLKDILSDAFHSYDADGSGTLEEHECHVFFRDFHESVTEEEMGALFKKFDLDNSGTISMREFIGLAYSLIKEQASKEKPTVTRKIQPDATNHVDDGTHLARTSMVENAFNDVEEEEDIPDELTDLPPDQQQAAIKKKAFTMLAIGTALVVMFSDPMVDVMQEIAVRGGVSPFYVSFILAPLASNASEVLSSQYYASKKTRKTITVSLSALEGAACMNNTFCLSIFMGLIFFRGLAWAYTAETIAIVVVEMIVGALVQFEQMTTLRALAVGLIFPLSIVLVASLEALGFD